MGEHARQPCAGGILACDWTLPPLTRLDSEAPRQYRRVCSARRRADSDRATTRSPRPSIGRGNEASTSRLRGREDKRLQDCQSLKQREAHLTPSRHLSDRLFFHCTLPPLDCPLTCILPIAGPAIQVRIRPSRSHFPHQLPLLASLWLGETISRRRPGCDPTTRAAEPLNYPTSSFLLPNTRPAQPYYLIIRQSR